MKHQLQYLLLLLHLLSPLMAFAQQGNCIVEKRLYTFADGLPGNKVTCVTQDQLGYIWVGTQYGLCRFDGQKFQLFTSKSSGLKNLAIGAIYPDIRRGLVICYQSNATDKGASSKNMDVMDVQTLKVQTLDAYYNYPGLESKLADVNGLYHLHGICYGFFPKQYVYADLKSRATSPILVINPDGSITEKKRNIVKAIHFASVNGDVKVNTSDYSPQMDFSQFDAFQMDDGELILSEFYDHYFLYRDTNGVVISHNVFNKYYVYHVDVKGNVRLLGIGVGQLGQYKFIADRIYYYLFSGLEIAPQKSFIIFSPENSGVLVFDSTESLALLNANVYSMLHDKLGYYWVATSAGLLKISITPKLFHSFASAQQETLPGIFSTRGIFANNQFSVVSLNTHLSFAFQGRQQRVENALNHSVALIDNTLWLGSYRLQTFDFRTEKITEKAQSISAEIWSIFPLSGNKLVLGCTDNLDCYDTLTHKIEHIPSGNFPTPHLVYRIFKDAQQHIVCVADNGIYFISADGKLTDYFAKEAKQPGHQLPCTGINDLFIDNNGIWWLATPMEGLFRWDRKKNTFENYGIDEGFLTVKLCRIEEDLAGRLWISTDFGLACFNKETHLAKNFTTVQGIQNMEFNRSSSFKQDNGTLWFGTVDGCISFNPEEVFQTSSRSDFPFLLTGIKKFNAELAQYEDASEELKRNQYIELSGNRLNLNLSVLLLDLEDRRHIYTYEIIGQDQTRNYSYDGQINLENLAFGTYTLLVNAQHSNGAWDSHPIKIELHVLPPFYRTWWFITLVILAVITGAYLFFRYRIRQVERQNARLELTISERTKELRESLAEQTALLQEVHHRVKNNLQFIAAMLQMQIKSVKDETNKAVLKETSVRINSMSLVHEMLYNKDKLEFIRIDEYLRELVSKLQELVYGKQLPIHFDLEVEQLNFSVNDSVALGMLTSEIISNSIKYAFTDISNPEIHIRLRRDSETQTITYEIRDNGNGIDETKKNQGLGQRLIDIFSRQLEAQYTVKSNQGVAYTFIITAK